MDRGSFNRMVEEIAEHLPGEWEFRPFASEEALGGRLIDHASGALLLLSDGSRLRQPEKVHVSSDVPRDSRGERPYLGLGTKLPDIHVSWRKTPEQIAREIERRIFPSYLPILADAVERNRATEEYHGKVERMARRIAELVGVEVDKRDPSRVSFYRSRVKIFAETLSEAKVSDDTVKLELDLPHEHALAVLRLLAKG